MEYNMKNDNFLDVLNEKIKQISNTIFDFDPSFLFTSNINSNTNAVPVTIEIISNNGIKKSVELNLIPLLDITGYNSEKKEAFVGNNISTNYIIPKDRLSQMYFTSLGVLGIYILFNIMKKTKMIPT